MKNKVYINGMAAISPQETFATDAFLDTPISYQSNYFLAIDADYKKYINPVQIRRMSRILKMTLSAAKEAMNDAGLEQADAIITGSGYGCIDDTEKFLLNMLDNDESMLNPTAFMQSTHNSVSGMVALHLKCYAYNYTYVHRGFSFESAVLDAMMLLSEEKENVLVGGFEENSVNHHFVTDKLGFWKKEAVNTFDLLSTDTKGTVSGEGASFMVLGNRRNEHTYAEIKDIKLLYKPDEQDILAALKDFLAKHHVAADQIDIVLCGLNGDVEMDKIYYKVHQQLFEDATLTWFKHMCGEYYTAASFGCWVAAQILRRQSIPDILMVAKTEIGKPVRYILMYNHYQHINHCFYLFEA